LRCHGNETTRKFSCEFLARIFFDRYKGKNEKLRGVFLGKKIFYWKVAIFHFQNFPFLQLARNYQKSAQ